MGSDKKKILITGASGFIGYHFIDYSIQKELDVYAAIRPSSNIDHLKEFPVTYLTIDYKNKEQLKELFQKHQFNYVIHNAGATKAESDEEYIAINAGIPKAIAEAIEETTSELTKFIFISSLAAQGPAKDVKSNDIQVTDSPNPITMYGRSKLIAEEYLAKTKSLNYTIFRPTAVYGPLEKNFFILIKSINSGLEPYLGRTEQKFSFIYVEDLTKVIIDSLDLDTRGKKYIVTDGNTYDRYEFSNIIKKELNKKTLKFHIPIFLVKIISRTLELAHNAVGKTATLNQEKLNELTALNWSCNISNTIEELNYTPQFNLEKGLNKTLSWYKKHKWI